MLVASAPPVYLRGTASAAAAARQIALIWSEVIKCGKGDLRLRLGGDVTMRAADLGPVLHIKKAGCVPLCARACAPCACFRRFFARLY